MPPETVKDEPVETRIKEDPDLISQDRNTPIEISSRHSTSPSSEPGSSPLVPQTMASGTMGPPLYPASATAPRKRSYEQANADATSVDSSHTAVAQLTPKGRLDNTTTDALDPVQSDSHAQDDSIMEQQPTPPISSKAVQTQRAPPSGQGPRKPPKSHSQSEPSSRSAEDKADGSPTEHDGPDDRGTDRREADPSAEEADPGSPGSPISDFDWHDLEFRWHSRMTELAAKEQSILDDFNRHVDVRLDR